MDGHLPWIWCGVENTTGMAKSGVLLAGRLVLAAAPAMLALPMGVGMPDSGAPIDAVPSPAILSPLEAPTPQLTPKIWMAHPMSRRNLFACTPWILLSVLGLTILIDMLASHPLARNLTLGALAASLLFHSASFVKYYFTEYPVVTAPYFQYGIEQALAAAHRLNNGSEFTIVTKRINQPYVYPLFYDRYDPEKYQRENVLKAKGLFGPVVRFDHYVFYGAGIAYSKYDHGVIVFDPTEVLPAKPVARIDYPTGNPAYFIVVK